MPECAKAEIVRLTSASSLQEAEIWKSALEQEGIRCKVTGDYPTAGYGLGIHPFYPGLWVHREDAERVKIILKSHLKKK